MTPNETKTLRQQTFVNQTWFNANGKGIFVACTGFGKSRVALMAIKLSNERAPQRVIHVVVPSTHLKKSWEKQCKEWGFTNVTVFVGNTYVKLMRTCDFLIVDELHNYANNLAMVFRRIISDTKFSFFLGLTATLSPDKMSFLLSKGLRVLDTVTLTEAKRMKWVSDFKVLCLGLDLNDTDRENYKKLHENFNKYFAIFNHNFDLAMSCMQSADASEEFAKTLSDEWTAQRVRVAAINWNRNMQKRKALLYHADAKITCAARLIKSLNRHTIAFCQSTAGADTLETYIGGQCKAYHSKKGIRDRRLILKSFIDKEISCLSAAEALDEGFDVEHIELGVIWARTSVPLQSVQRIGRAIRFVADKTAFIIQVYIKDSQDENWLKKSLKGTPGIIWLEHESQVLDLIASYQTP